MKAKENIINKEFTIEEIKPGKKSKRYWHKLERREVRKELQNLVRFNENFFSV